ncbi:3-oxoacyl-ACP synthase III [Georgenia yuyongxinii]|uniref:3-oxoacyl-ACP synthase III n=1 Tax=Georgenia yuyongxinii TaxID=2589797 RepID=A0A552WXC3_9MICO|nr:3-oxoacyl-ACP synthase III [Georgenia yuyongxinii]TRW47491.1 3-oxoacyl-ACP synthase III [Georgenia yuyongxinii]
MSHRGNATFRYRESALIALAHIEAPVVVTSAEFEQRLAPARRRLRLPDNLLERVSGVRERRWWQAGTAFEDMAAEAGSKALAEAGVDPGEVGLLINTSVSRSSLEPSVAVRIHDRMGLPSSALNFDITNACVGFVNGLQMASAMIEAGQIEYAVVVNSEDVRSTQEDTLERLLAEGATRKDYTYQFASLTLGDGAAAAVVGRASTRPDGHRILGGVARAGTEHHDLCVGSFGKMTTDTKKLLSNGLKLVTDAWHEAERDGWSWRAMDRYVTHQISTPYTQAIVDAMDLDPAAVPITFDRWGNVGPASIAMTLSEQAESLSAGDRVMCLGVGSGLNTAMLELAW